MNFKYYLYVLILTVCFFVQGNTSEQPLYLDSSQSIEKRVEDLLSRMTLEEKVGQMNMPARYGKNFGTDNQSQIEAGKKHVLGTYIKGIGPGGGLFSNINQLLPEGARQQAEFNNKLQKMALDKTRLKIPLLMIEEGTHGFMASGATIFPEGLGIGSTWNMDLVRKIYSVAAKEARAAGVHGLCTLVIEPNRDPRLGRNEEGYSECPFLCSQIARSIVQGIQGDNISADDKAIAFLCHYPGQSEPVSGMERGSMNISERMLREIFLPPWVEGIKKAGAFGVMATYPAIDGVPVHNSDKILKKILREELGFRGIVLSEGFGIGTLMDEQITATQKEAGALAVKTGINVSITFEEGYLKPLIENVREGKVSEETINNAVRWILGMKFRLGLFENPYVDSDYAVEVSNTEEHKKLALQTAHEGIVLLKNENNLLPLKKDIKSIAVIGPNANNDRNQLGDYIANTVTQDIITVLEGIKNKVSDGTKVEYVKGCEVVGTEFNEIKKAQDAAKNADVVIVVVGEDERFAPSGGTNGEGRDVASLDLSGLQQDLIKAVYESGTPTVVVLINGRPLSIRWTAEHVPVIIEAWNCGEQGGNAVADILFGDVNPSGRLAITIPRHVGQLPVYYNFNPPKAKEIKSGGYVDMSGEPLYEFGYGLSYSEFEYSNLRISPKVIGPGSDVNIRVDVENVSDKEGCEVVQLYINDVISSVVTPYKELKGFEKIRLKPGEKKTVEFKLTYEHLSMLDRHLERVVEPGIFDVMIGSSSKDIRVKGSFECK